MFSQPPESNRPPLFNRNPKKGPLIEALDFIMAVFRSTYLVVGLVSILGFLGASKTAGFIVSLFGGPETFYVAEAFRMTFYLLAGCLITGFVRFAMYDGDLD